MKTRFSKKLLSAFLALVMVITSIPMFAITASAATVIEEQPVIDYDFTDSSLYSSTSVGANPTVTTKDGKFTLSTAANTNNESGGFAQYDSAGLSISRGNASIGIAKQTISDNFRITLTTTVGSPMDNSDRAIISLGNDGSWNNILDWTCGEIHVLSPGTVGGTAGDGTYVFANPYENSGLGTFVIEMLDGTLTLKYNNTTLYTQSGCAIKGSEIDYIRLFDDDNWWGGTGVIQSLTVSNLARVEANKDFYRRYLDKNFPSAASQGGYCVDGAADGSYNSGSLFGTIGSSDRDIMSNVLYTYGVGDSAPYNSEVKQNNLRAGLQYGTITFLYDGENDMATPVSLYCEKTGTLANRRLRSMSPKTADFTMKKNWQGGDSGAGYKTNSNNRINVVNANDPAGANASGVKYYSNTLYYTGTTDGKAYKTIPSITWDYYNNQGSHADATQTVPIYIVNYKPLHDIIKDKTTYQNITAKECKYTDAALLAYYQALYNLLQFDITSSTYDYSQESGAVAAGQKIQSLANAYNTALANLENNLNTDTSENTTHSFVSTVVAPTCTTDGYTRHVCSVCQYEYTDAATSATGHEVNYVYTTASTTTHTVSCSKGDMTAFTEDCADTDHDGNCDKCGQSLLAVFDTYNNEKGLLLGMLKDDAFAAADLEALEEAISAFTYFNYTDAQQAVEPGTSQRAINEEADQIKALRTALKEYTLDISAAEAAAGGLEGAIKDVDRYDTSAIDAYKNDKDGFYKKSVTVAGTSYKAFLYNTQDELNAAVKSLVESLNDPNNIRSYTVYIDGVPCVDSTGSAVKVPYGTAVTVDSNGTINVNVTDTDANYDGDPVAWRYSYAAPSNNNTATQPKYMITAPSFGFIVKGDTYLTTSKATSTSDNFTVTVLAKQNGNKIIDRVATAGSYTMPNDPSYVGYKFSGYSNGAVPGQEITVTADTTIYAEYVVDKSNTYAIDFYDNELGFSGVEVPVPTKEIDATYNQLVSLEAPNAYCWAKAYYDLDAGIFTYNIIHYGSKYSFYACETIGDRAERLQGLVAMTKDEYTTVLTSTDGLYEVLDSNGNAIQYTGNEYDGYKITDNATVTSLDNLVNVYNNNGEITKYAMVGHYILPEGYSMVECGFIYASDTSVTDLKVESVDNAKTFRFKSSRYTVGNQFVINLVNDGVTTTFNYVPYAIVKNGSTTTTVYGAVHENVTIN